MQSHLPPQHRALLLKKRGADLEIEIIPTPQPTLGTAVCRVLEAGVLSYHREIYNGQRHYPFPTPIIGGCSAIGRIVAVGEDATILTPGKLVWVDCVIRGRDDPSNQFLFGIHDGMTEGSRKLSRDVWRNGSFSEFVKAPLENCIPLDEARLCQDLGYSVRDLVYLSHLLVPFGGLRDITLQPGETVIVCPATGGFGGAGVHVAAAMGARVIAMGRNEKELARLKAYVEKGFPSATIETVKISGDEAAETAALQAFGTIDAVLDLAPPAAAGSTHLKGAINALRHEGRCSAMGYVTQPIVDWKFMARNISLKGKLMYERNDIVLFVKMLERGLFPKSPNFVDTKSFSLDDWKQAFDAAAEYTGVGRIVSISP
jgi:threonine dehydrogenase-like Zn-dependent dehydrogenase